MPEKKENRELGISGVNSKEELTVKLINSFKEEIKSKHYRVESFLDSSTHGERKVKVRIYNADEKYVQLHASSLPDLIESLELLRKRLDAEVTVGID